MSEQDLLQLIEHNKYIESEILEFKEWKNSIPFANGGKKESDKKKCVYGYCVGIGNEWGGKLLIWVNDDGEIVGTKAELQKDAKQRIYAKTEQKIGIEEIQTTKGKVIVLDIPSRKSAQLLKFNGVALMRVHDWLTEMDDTMIKKILNETQIDRSWLPCVWTTIDDLEPVALQFLKDKKAEITKNDDYKNLDTKTFLNQMSLLTEKGIPNNTCILFVGKQLVAERKLPAISRFARLYVDEKNGIEDRLTAENQRSPLILTIEKIIEKIQKYNMPLEDVSLFRSDTEYQYHEKAIEELIANSLAHRDREILIHNEIRQTPHSLVFSNPGKFENDLNKVLEYSQVTPYKNQTMADFLSKINLMENERRWLQKVFTRQLSKWVFVRKREIDNQSGGIVQMILDGKVTDMNFAKLVFQVKNMHRLDMILLQTISEGKNLVGEDLTEEKADELRRLWYIELYGKSPNRKARVSYELLDEIGQTEKYILDKWIGTKKKEKLILEYIEKKGSISTQEVYKLFPEANRNSLRSILLNMKSSWTIKSIWFSIYGPNK